MSRGAPYFISGDSAAALSPVLHYLHNERTMIYEEAYFNKNLTDKTIEEDITEFICFGKVKCISEQNPLYGHDLQKDFGKLNPLDSLIKDKAIIRMDKRKE